MGVLTVDMSKLHGSSWQFNMRGIFMWTITDFPTYTMISKQANKGYIGYLICGKYTLTNHTTVVEKTIFLGKLEVVEIKS